MKNVKKSIVVKPDEAKNEYGNFLLLNEMIKGGWKVEKRVVSDNSGNVWYLLAKADRP